MIELYKLAIFSLLLVFFCCGTVTRDKDKTPSEGSKVVYIHPMLESYVNSYNNSIRERNMVQFVQNRTIDTVNFTMLDYPKVGLTFRGTDGKLVIYINKWSAIDECVLKTVVYHEMTHAVFGIKEHPCGTCMHIFSEKSPDYRAIYTDWGLYEDQLFNTIENYFRQGENWQ